MRTAQVMKQIGSFYEHARAAIEAQKKIDAESKENEADRKLRQAAEAATAMAKSPNETTVAATRTLSEEDREAYDALHNALRRQAYRDAGQAPAPWQRVASSVSAAAPAAQTVERSILEKVHSHDNQLGAANDHLKRVQSELTATNGKLEAALSALAAFGEELAKANTRITELQEQLSSPVVTVEAGPVWYERKMVITKVLRKNAGNYTVRFRDEGNADQESKILGINKAWIEEGKIGFAMTFGGKPVDLPKLNHFPRTVNVLVSGELLPTDTLKSLGFTPCVPPEEKYDPPF
jgi:myosin heavy subunit